MGKLTQTFLKKVKEPGKYIDGNGLYLFIGKTGSKSWVFRYSLNKKPREMGLGSFDTVSIEEARDLVIGHKKTLKSGNDPMSARSIDRARAIASQSKNITFRQCAEMFIDSQKVAWTNRRQAPIWRASLETHTYDLIGDLPVSEVTIELVIRIIRKMWDKKDEDGNPTPLYDSAMRVRGRIERVLSYATALKYRVGENPARWRDNLEHIIPDPLKNQQRKHQPSIPREELPDLFKTITKKTDPTHDALAFLILTATRTGEVTGSTWSEIDFENKTWTIPGERMKTKRPHRVPLSDAALDILSRRSGLRMSGYIFPGRIAGRPISNMAMLMIMRRYGREEVPHGFRSTFKDWASEVAGSDDDVSEAALAHVVKNKTKAAYLRGDFFEKRRELMQSWASFCHPSFLQCVPEPLT